MGASVQWNTKEEKKKSPFPEFSYGVRFGADNCERVVKGEWTWETGMNRNQITESERIRDYGLLVVYSNWSYLKNHELAAAEGQECIIANMYIGGCSLERHLNNARKDLKAYIYQKIGLNGVRCQTNNMTLSNALKDEPWDYISLQQASGFSGIYDSYTPFLPELIHYIKTFISPKTKLIWHQTCCVIVPSIMNAKKNVLHLLPLFLLFGIIR